MLREVTVISSVWLAAGSLLFLFWSSVLYPLWLSRVCLRAAGSALKVFPLFPAPHSGLAPFLSPESEAVQYVSWLVVPSMDTIEARRARELRFGAYTAFLHRMEHDLLIQTQSFGATYPVDTVWYYAGKEAFERTSPVNMRLVIYFHGGDFVSGGANSSNSFLLSLSRRIGAPVVAVEYTLCPEAFDLEVVHREAMGLWVSLWNAMFIPENIVLMGEGVGASIIMRLLHELSLESDLPAPGGVVFISPITDLTFSYASISKNADRDGMRDVGVLRSNIDLALRTWMTEAEENGNVEPVVPKDKISRPPDDPKVSPFRLKFPSKFKFPPTMIYVGEYEVTHGDAELLRKACSDAGADVSWLEQPHAISYLLELHDFLPEAERPFEKIAAFVRQHWRSK
eukprot:gb/GEZN01008741.1/.p1 GENE.gb/GEZN01008741.1/~~gb/GEZN01008741.1/.p1  ORF type:complete len:397 (-),score=41.38 gb/GEZN01008741.1/:187-1377(-)